MKVSVLLLTTAAAVVSHGPCVLSLCIPNDQPRLLPGGEADRAMAIRGCDPRGGGCRHSTSKGLQITSW